MGYYASVTLDALILTTMKTRDLAVSLDQLVVLTAVKEHYQESHGETHAIRVRRALVSGLEQHGTTASDMGLRFVVWTSEYFWIGKRTLMTPRFHSVEMALNAADALLPYRRHRGSKYLNNLTGLVQAEKTWDRFKETYISICVAGGWDGDRVASRLRSWENANKSHREQLLEKLNRRRMATEELLQ